MGACNELVYDTPATDWREGLPLGTGRLSAMMYGTPELARILLNHEWLWRGRYQTKDTVDTSQALPKVRELLLAGRLAEGTVLGNVAFGGLGGLLENREYADKVGQPQSTRHLDPYQPAGELCFALDGGPVGFGLRRLDLENALAETVFTLADGRRITETCLASLVRDVLVVRLSADTGVFSGRFWLERIEDPDCMTLFEVAGSTLIMDGMFQDGIDFRIDAEIRTSGGSVRVAGDGGIQVDGAREILVITNVGTSARKGIPAAESRIRLPDPVDWGELLTEHIACYQKKYGGFSLDIDTDGRAQAQTTDRRRTQMLAGGADPLLPLLYFNLGRYMLICGSANAQLPLNIRAKWNGELRPAWDSDIHNNVNFQMCYWMAEAASLQDTMPPFFDYVERMLPRARKAARDLYGCRGALFPMQTDCWGRATPESFGYAAWIGAGAWLAQHYWKHYEYGQTRAFLGGRAYPLMKEVALFYEDYLVEDENGNLQIVPSQSPENSVAGSGEAVTLCVSAACDVQLARELLTNTARAAETLGIDAEKAAKWREMARRLPGIKIGKHGQIQEWDQDYDEAELRHRHFSQLYGLFPGDEIAAAGEDLLRAARISVDRRLVGGLADHPLQRAWLTFLYARLRDRCMAWDSLVDSILHFTPAVLFRMDVFLAVPAMVCEMLLGDYGGKLRLLPVLPAQWPDGSVCGLRTRGGYTARIEWKHGRLVFAELLPVSDGTCVLVDEGYSVLHGDGRPFDMTKERGDLVFQTRAGEVCRIVPIVDPLEKADKE